MKEKITLLNKHINKRKVILLLLSLSVLIIIIYDYMFYTIDVGKTDEIVAIRMFEPFNGPIYTITDKDIIDEYLKTINGKRLTNDGFGHLIGKSYHICFYNKDDEVVYEFWTLGGNMIMVQWGIIYVCYEGDIEAGVSIFEQHGR